MPNEAGNAGGPGRGVAVAAIALMVLIWGTTWGVIRIGLQSVPPFTGAALRFVVAAAVLAAVAATRGLPLRPSDRREAALWVAHGSLAFLGSYSITYWTEQYVPSGLTAVLFATFPLWVAILGHFWLPGERLQRATAAGVLLGFVGVAVIFSEDLALLGGPEVATAAAVMLFSPLASAIGNVVVKRWGERTHPITLNAGGMTIGAAALGVLAAVLEGEAEVRWTFAGIGSILYLALFGSALAFVLYFWLLRTMPARRLALIAYLVPVVAVSIGVVFLDEPLTARTLAGAALVVGGTVLGGRR